VTLTLTSDDLESHIIVNVSSTLTNTTIWFVAAHVFHCGRTYGRTDVFTGFIRSSLRRWPKNVQYLQHCSCYMLPIRCFPHDWEVTQYSFIHFTTHYSTKQGANTIQLYRFGTVLCL